MQTAEFFITKRTWPGGESAIVENENPPQKLSETVDFAGILLVNEPGELGELDREGKKIKFYTVFPLYANEIAYEKKRGIVGLLEKFQKKEIGTIFKKNNILFLLYTKILMYIRKLLKAPLNIRF